MKTFMTFALLCLIAISLTAQTDTMSVDVVQQELDRMATISDDSLNETNILSPDTSVVVKKDTVRIRVGNRSVEIVSGNDNTYIDIEKMEEFESKWEKKSEKSFEQEFDVKKHSPKKKRKRFNGHWAGIEFGGNQLLNIEYPDGAPAYLTTLPQKSFEVNWNFYEYSFGFCPYIGIVTGLGLNFNDYKFKYRYTLAKDDNGIIQPVALPEGDFRLSKISTGYLQAPLLLEFQIPGYTLNQKFFLAGGVIGGLKLGDHTKTQIGKEKLKDKGDHNIAPLRWGYTARVGFDNFGLYATYYNTPFFEKDKGPSATPFTIGATLTF
jgi:hypothetical protein